MPTYSYKCTSCGNAFDIQQAFTDSSLTECPECGKALRKVFGNVGVTFNGSGFYRTDSRAAKTASEAKSKPAPKSDKTPSATPAPSSTSSSAASAASS